MTAKHIDKNKRNGRKGKKFELDPSTFPPNPRILDIPEQVVYIINCLEHGLSQEDIIELFTGDYFTVNAILQLLNYYNLIEQDTKGNWKRTLKIRSNQQLVKELFRPK